MLPSILVVLAVIVAFLVGAGVQKKNDLVGRAQKGEQAALDAIKAKLNLK